jgi:UDP-glucose-4-epimerase GalE
MKILVTGGAGYIGSHACKAIASAGMVPITYDNLSTGHEWAVKWGPFVKGDLEDGGRLRDAIRRFKVDAVMHFAAHSLVGESVKNPRKYYHNNLANTLLLLDAMADTEVRLMVFSSTCAVYGLPETEFLDESHPVHPVNPYGETKLAIERALSWYGKAFGIGWMALRYFNAAGADESGEIGEAHKNETHLIPLVLDSVVTEQPVSIFGIDYPTPDGSCIRDYIHVTDLADAHVRALQYLTERKPSSIVNLGTGRGLSVYEVIRSVERVTGLHVPVSIAGRRPGDPPKLVASAQRASSVLGWHPSHSRIEEIVRTAWQWKVRSTSVLPSYAHAG